MKYVSPGSPSFNYENRRIHPYLTIPAYEAIADRADKAGKSISAIAKEILEAELAPKSKTPAA